MTTEKVPTGTETEETPTGRETEETPTEETPVGKEETSVGKETDLAATTVADPATASTAAEP